MTYRNFLTQDSTFPFFGAGRTVEVIRHETARQYRTKSHGSVPLALSNDT